MGATSLCMSFAHYGGMSGQTLKPVCVDTVFVSTEAHLCEKLQQKSCCA